MPIVFFIRTSRHLRVKSLVGVGAALGLALLAAGCGGTVARMPLVGEPAHIPPAPEVQPAYPPVGVSTSTRTGKPMTAAERAKVEASIARDRAQAAAERRKKIQKQDAPE